LTWASRFEPLPLTPGPAAEGPTAIPLPLTDGFSAPGPTLLFALCALDVLPPAGAPGCPAKPGVATAAQRVRTTSRGWVTRIGNILLLTGS
jgi:hypothetical protein